ncbi:type VII secretion-associated serine protease mycosin [Nonomuraea solani]|uniref:Type VII secretion-associated serine protease mycosin n=1 Tax=Nonomuraea solani TaxID=1144553 RepID=A0A1H6ENP8_9ACTN|nr:S8 family serine peptidase [Nonomuraea solani]SEG99452.1 type VII secretion-associated serine protease mycosin [Nonomuraea solani]
MIGRALVASALALQVPLVPSIAKAVACDPARGTMEIGESWAQKRLDPKRVWPLSTGAGVKVAVIDTGVDLDHPQIRLGGKADLVGSGYRDCVGHGTAVAGIIGAQYMRGVLFYGMAPGATLLSYKFTDTERDADTRLLIKGIKAAADHGAKVINVSSKTFAHSELEAAVQYALAKDAVIVAAAGNVTNEDGVPSPAYPASYEGVLAVGAAGPNGTLAEFSNTKTPVSVIGPGENVTSTWAGRAYNKELDGTSYAAPYVAGVAALVRARYPKLDQAQIRQRIIATADGATGAGKGAGMVNPLLAVSAILPNEPANAPVVAPPPPSPLPASAITHAPPVDQDAIDLAVLIAGCALGLALLLTVIRAVVPMGQRRGWRPGRSE